MQVTLVLHVNLSSFEVKNWRDYCYMYLFQWKSSNLQKERPFNVWFKFLRCCRLEHRDCKRTWGYVCFPVTAKSEEHEEIILSRVLNLKWITFTVTYLCWNILAQFGSFLNGDCRSLTLLQCKRNIGAHKSALALTGVENEVDLILSRASMFAPPRNVEKLNICPRHRESLGLGWRCPSSKFSVPNVLSSHSDKPAYLCLSAQVRLITKRN